MYHYAEGSNPITEAEYFIEKIAEFLGDVILALDRESIDNQSFGVNDFDWCKTWLDHVYEKTGVRPLLYCPAAPEVLT